MNLGRVGVWSGGLRRYEDPAEIARAAAELEELGYSALFVPGGAGGDILAAAERLLAATRSIPVVTGILNIWMHDALEAAEGFHAFERDYPGRFVLGLGVSHAPLVDAKEAGRYRRPLSAMRAYLDALDEAEPPVPRDRRLLAALAPRMLELARERAAGAHPYFVPVEHTRFARETLGPGPTLAVEQGVVLETHPTDARARAREHMSVYLGLPNYVDNLLRHGFGEDDVRDGGSDRLVDAIVAWGDEQTIAERVGAHHEAGADHVCIQIVGGFENALPLDQWRRLAGALVR